MYDSIIENNKQPGIAIPKSIYHISIMHWILKVYKYDSKNQIKNDLKTITKAYFVKV